MPTKPGAKYATRPTSVKDAKAMGLLPSVTTVLDTLSKPMLTDWKVEEGIRAALIHAYNTGSSDPALIPQIKDSANAYVAWASEFGTLIHGYVADILCMRTAVAESPQQWKAKEIAEVFVPKFSELGFELQHSEYPFVNETGGWAGTIDFLGSYRGEPVVADFKTRDMSKPVAYYDEQLLQLAGYAVGIGQPHRKRVSVLIDRERPGLMDIKFWGKEEADWADEAWGYLTSYWYASKKWRRGNDNRDIEYTTGIDTLYQAPSLQALE